MSPFIVRDDVDVVSVYKPDQFIDNQSECSGTKKDPDSQVGS